MYPTSYNARILEGIQGIPTNHSQGVVLGVALRSALNGDLTISGVTNSNGSAASWVIPAGSTAFSAAPGSQKFWRAVSFAYADVADSGKAVLIFQPL